MLPSNGEPSRWEQKNPSGVFSGIRLVRKLNLSIKALRERLQSASDRTSVASCTRSLTRLALILHRSLSSHLTRVLVDIGAIVDSLVIVC